METRIRLSLDQPQIWEKFRYPQVRPLIIRMKKKNLVLLILIFEAGSVFGNSHCHFPLILGLLSAYWNLLHPWPAGVSKLRHCKFFFFLSLPFKVTWYEDQKKYVLREIVHTRLIGERQWKELLLGLFLLLFFSRGHSYQLLSFKICRWIS